MVACVDMLLIFLGYDLLVVFVSLLSRLLHLRVIGCVCQSAFTFVAF